MTVYQYNSADNHIDQRWIPANLWQDRVRERFKDAAPRVVEHEGTWVWEWEGRVFAGRDGGAADLVEKAWERSAPRRRDGGTCGTMVALQT